MDEITRIFVALTIDPNNRRNRRLNACSGTICKLTRAFHQKKGRQMEALPPTRAALFQHVKRATYQAGNVWCQSLISALNLPYPIDWGWKIVSNEYVLLWTTLSDAWVSSRELLKCGCNIEKGCSGRCTCARPGFPCTELCKCNGDCESDV